MKRWLVFLPLAFLLGAIALFGFFALGRNTRVEPNAMVGKPVPTLTAPLLEGGPPVTLASQIKGPALVNLFASYCAPCIIEAPLLDEMKARGARIVGLAQKDEPANTARFLERYGDPFAVVLDDRAGMGVIEFGATGIPETFVIDSNGVIVGKHTGALENKEHVEALMAVLEKAD
jgi:cytochrome c biogenesis protein CcmG/thiol:disulfide interchange protein DsbE